MNFFYKSFKEKKSGSMILVVMMLTAFCTTILTLFLENAFDDAKYRQQMQSSARLKVEAYAFLDLALDFLDKYRKEANAEKLSGENPPINKGADQLVFDSDILGADPNAISIGNYITQKVHQRLSRKEADFPKDFPPVVAVTSTAEIPGQLKHGDYCIRYEFEDLTGKIPLCKEFFSKTGIAFRTAVMDMIPSNQLGVNEKENVGKFIDQNLTFTGWSAVEKIARGESLLSRTASPCNVEYLKQWFTIEPAIIKAQKSPPTHRQSQPSPSSSSKRSSGKGDPNNASKTSSTSNPAAQEKKLNLLTVKPEILQAIAKSYGGLALPSARTFMEYQQFINVNGALKSYCGLEVQFFALTVSVTAGGNNTFILRCICEATRGNNAQTPNRRQNDAREKIPDATPNAAAGKRWPFNMIKMEEF
ncbi:MAG: hypothetical protein LBB11_01875 [Puniceicoccales bacterium]|jgi:hypothetical protein|nr:hypothetical protein [Puniceicoccales bacterium]